MWDDLRLCFRNIFYKPYLPCSKQFDIKLTIKEPVLKIHNSSLQGKQANLIGDKKIISSYNRNPHLFWQDFIGT